MGLFVILFFLGILISKQIASAPLFSFQLRIKILFHKNITDDSIIFLTEVKCKGNIQITHMEEKKHNRVIRLMMKLTASEFLQEFLKFLETPTFPKYLI